MKRKKWIVGVLCLTMVLSLAGCKKHEHVWTDATCTEPKTCAECQEVEGEALGHAWIDATCTEPKTCSRCGETEGEALGHTWADATYQTAATCTVCGETDGEPLTPDFVAYGLALAEQGQAYDCILVCNDDASQTTVSHVTVADYQIFDADDTHPAKEGYEYRQAAFDILCDDANAYAYGARFNTRFENYYDIKALDDSAIHNEDGTVIFTVNFDGQEQECTYSQEVFWDPWVGNTVTGHCVSTVMVPVGYDGMVVGVYDDGIPAEEDTHIYDMYQPDHFVLFRMA